MKRSLNLMTDEARRFQLLRQSRQVWLRVLWGTTLLMAGMGGLEWWRGTATTRRLTDMEARYEPVQVLKEECLQLRSEINVFRATQQMASQLMEDRPLLTLLATLLKADLQTDHQVFLEQLEVSPRATETNNPHARHVVLEGAGKTSAAVAQFAEELRASELFTDVSFESRDRRLDWNQAVHAFRIECQY